MKLFLYILGGLFIAACFVFAALKMAFVLAGAP
jgi:hypothetical protein